LLDFHGSSSVVIPDDSPARDQLQGALVVELGRPTDSKLKAPPREQDKL
jgi:hypothetical protein